MPRRDAFQQDVNEQGLFWSKFGLSQPEQDELRISMFCYENPALPELFQMWAEGERTITCLVPEGIALESLAKFFPLDKNLTRFTRGRLSIHTIPFTDQDQYDELLWACDVNFVRGEDSFVRAQWAAQPFIWHIYPQEENAHWAKLNAFTDAYCAGMSAQQAAATQDFWRAFNAGSGVGATWPAFARALPALRQHNRAWAAQLAARPDLASGLADFCRKLIK